MQLKGVTATQIKATHETPKAHYIDDLTFTVQANSTSKLCNMQVSQTSTLSLKIALFREHNVHSFCYFGLHTLATLSAAVCHVSMTCYLLCQKKGRDFLHLRKTFDLQGDVYLSDTAK